MQHTSLPAKCLEILSSRGASLWPAHRDPTAGGGFPTCPLVRQSLKSAQQPGLETEAEPVRAVETDGGGAVSLGWGRQASHAPEEEGQGTSPSKHRSDWVEQGDGWTLFSTDIQRGSNGDTASRSPVHRTERKLPTALSSMWQMEIPTCWRLSLSPRQSLLLGLPA